MDVPQPAGKKPTPDAMALSQGMSEVERRLRTMEERYSTLERRSQVTEENMLLSDRKIKAELKLLVGEVSELKAQLAEAIDMAPRFLQRLESGRVNLRIDSLVRLAVGLNVAPGALLRKAKLVASKVGRPRSRAK